MFHRVKSETLTESNEQSQDVNEETVVKAEEAEENAAETKAPVASVTQDTEENSAPTSSTPATEKKETKTMTTTTEDTKPAPAASEPSYTKSSQSAVRPGGYPGAYPGVAYGAQAVSQDEPTDRTLTIGAGITMSGEIESCDNLIVEGTVEAALKGARNLDIAESGTFYGTVDIEDAVIAGRFEGELTVNGRLVVRSGGIITGTIAYGTLEVEAGAIIDGRLTPVSALQSAQSAPAEEKKAAKASAPKAKVAKTEEAPAEAANSEGALFAAQG